MRRIAVTAAMMALLRVGCYIPLKSLDGSRVLLQGEPLENASDDTCLLQTVITGHLEGTPVGGSRCG